MLVSKSRKVVKNTQRTAFAQVLMDFGRVLKEAGRPQRAAEVYHSITLLEVRVL
jgi:hypothetical protein